MFNIFTILTCLTLVGCKLTDWIGIPQGASLLQVRSASAQPSAPTVIVCDVVAVLDKDLADKVSKMKSQEYFQTIGVLSRLHHDYVQVWRFEQLPQGPATVKKLVWTKSRCRPYGIFVFADYRSDHNHMVELDKDVKQIDLLFGADRIEKVNTHIRPRGHPTHTLMPMPTPESMNFAQS